MAQGFRLTPGRAQSAPPRIETRVIDAQEIRIRKARDEGDSPLSYIYEAGGRIKPIGGRAYRASEIQANSGMGRGDRVQVSPDGLVSATPSNGALNDALAAIQFHSAILEALPLSLGVQYISGDTLGGPNAVDDDGFLITFPRFENDYVIDLDTGVAYYWSGESEDIEADPPWKPVPSPAGLLIGDVSPDDPEAGFAGIFDGQQYYEQPTGALYRWNADLESEEPQPTWEVVNQVLHGVTGNPNDQDGAAIAVRASRAILVNDKNQIWIGDADSGAWSLATGSGGIFTFVIQSAEDLGYPILRADRAYTLTSLNVDAINDDGTVAGPYTNFTLSHAVGTEIAVDQDFIVTLTSTEGQRLRIRGVIGAV